MSRSTTRPPPVLLVAGATLCALLALTAHPAWLLPAAVLALWWAGNLLEWAITGR